MSPQLTSLSSQRGASVTSVVLLLIIIVVAGKLLVAIVPAQINDYQLTKMLSDKLKAANNEGDSAKQFIESVNQQLSINAYYDTTAEDLFVFTDKKAGQLAIRKDYNKTNNLFGNVDIVNRFEGDINSTSAE